MHRSESPPYTAPVSDPKLWGENSSPICQSDGNSCPGTWIGSPTWLECTCSSGHIPKLWSRLSRSGYILVISWQRSWGQSPMSGSEFAQVHSRWQLGSCTLVEIPGRGHLSWLSGSRGLQRGLQVPVNSNLNTCADFIVSSREVRDYISGSDLILHSWFNLKHPFPDSRLIR